MKKYIFPGLVIMSLAAGLFLQTACNNATPGGSSDSTSSIRKETAAVKATDTTTLAGKWILEPQLASDTASGRLPEITFNTGDGSFSGNNGCNRMSGHYSLRTDTLVFDERIITTRMACMGYNEKPFMDNLVRTNRFKIQNGKLTLYNNETILSTWVRYVEIDKDKKV